MKSERIKRINELAAIAKQRELTPQEIEERAVLRREYLDAVRANLRGQLDSITIVEQNGEKHPLRKKQ